MQYYLAKYILVYPLSSITLLKAHDRRIGKAGVRCNLHVADLPYRLSSWSLDDKENVRLWFASPQPSQAGFSLA